MHQTLEKVRTKKAPKKRSEKFTKAVAREYYKDSQINTCKQTVKKPSVPEDTGGQNGKTIASTKKRKKGVDESGAKLTSHPRITVPAEGTFPLKKKGR